MWAYDRAWFAFAFAFGVCVRVRVCFAFALQLMHACVHTVPFLLGRQIEYTGAEERRVDGNGINRTYEGYAALITFAGDNMIHDPRDLSQQLQRVEPLMSNTCDILPSSSSFRLFGDAFVHKIQPQDIHRPPQRMQAGAHVRSHARFGFPCDASHLLGGANEVNVCGGVQMVPDVAPTDRRQHRQQHRVLHRRHEGTMTALTLTNTHKHTQTHTRVDTFMPFVTRMVSHDGEGVRTHLQAYQDGDQLNSAPETEVRIANCPPKPGGNGYQDGQYDWRCVLTCALTTCSSCMPKRIHVHVCMCAHAFEFVCLQR